MIRCPRPGARSGPGGRNLRASPGVTRSVVPTEADAGSNGRRPRTARFWSGSGGATRRARRSCSSGMPRRCFGLRTGCCPTGRTAEEVTQEVFVKVITRAHQYDGRAEVVVLALRHRGQRLPGPPAARPPRARRPDRGTSRAGRTRRGHRETPASSGSAAGRRAPRPRRALRGTARGARPRPLPRPALCRDRDDARASRSGAVKTRIFRAVETLKARFSEGAASWNAAN